MLERFRLAKAAEIASLVRLQADGRMPPLYALSRPSFTDSLKSGEKSPVIAEYKRASPSRGTLNMHTTPEEAATAYAAAGAGAMSVLTEERFFKGDLSFLKRAAGSASALPLLRKDFILHPLQVDQTAATPASAVLLIARMVNEDVLRTLLERCRLVSLEAVVEVFDEADLTLARKAGAEIIQVNNRDLDRLQVHLGVSERLISKKRNDEFWITASGIHTSEQLKNLLDAGFDAALVGSSLMECGDPGLALRTLLGRNSHV